MREKAVLPFYSVERGLFNAAAPESSRGKCPVCAKDGRWEGKTFVPANERQAHHPRCYCATIHAGGGYAYDPVARTVLVRQVRTGISR